MVTEAIFAYLHYISFITLLTTLVVEWIIFDRKLTIREARLLGRADQWYGISAGMVIATGLLRAFVFGKGATYYFTNYIFLTKLGMVLVIGLLSIYPTVVFVRWRKQLKENPTHIELPEDVFRKIKTIIRMELVLAALVPLLATLMARGIGFAG